MGSTEDEAYVESFVCKVSDLEKANKSELMKEVDVGENGKCLLVRHKDGEITAVGHKCTHYGAPLIKGVLSDGKIRCPWHGACFNGRTGDIEDFPGLDSLHKFKVTVRNDDVIVSAKKRHLTNNKRNALIDGKTCNASLGGNTTAEADNHRVVIIGGGPSSLVCAETLRKEGFTGRVIILCKEHHLPYDRPKLSKALNISPEIAYLRGDASYYKEIGVELHNDTEVESVDVVTKSVKLLKPLTESTTNEGLTVKYDELVIATGGKPRTLEPTPGWNLKNVFVLRTPDEANAIAEASKGKRVIVVGASFIGMEVASFLAMKEIPSSVSVVCGRRSAVPFQSSLGQQVGGVVMKLHQEMGSVKFHPLVGVEGLSAKSGTDEVSHVTLSDGSIVEADVVVVGIGVTPATEFLRESEINLTNGFIAVDGRMQTKVPHVYAIGDVAMFPLNVNDGELTNIQHWQMAHAHGRIAALDIVHSLRRAEKGLYAATQVPRPGKNVNSVPFFWTVQFGKSIRYAGHGVGFDDVVIRGELEERKFVAYYVKDDVVVSVATLMCDPEAAKFAEKLSAGEKTYRKDIPDSLQ